MVSHRAGTSTYQLQRSLELALLRVRELPLKTGHEVLAKGHRQLKDKALVLSVSLAGHACSLQQSLEGRRVTLSRGSCSSQQGLHFFGVAGHLAVVRLEDALELLSSLLLRLGSALGPVREELVSVVEEGARQNGLAGHVEHLLSPLSLSLSK